MPCTSSRRALVCRIGTVAAGLALFTAGVRIGDLWGLVLMIVGLVPAVTGIADVSLLAEIRDERAYRREQRHHSPFPLEPRALAPNNPHRRGIMRGRRRVSGTLLQIA